METDVSIIIPLYNQLSFTKVCIEYLMRNSELAFELVLVDNASSDQTQQYLGILQGPVKKIVNRENLGFAKACNQGARAARGKYLVFLNNDTAVHKGWLRNLLVTLADRPEIGIVGPKLVYPDNTIQQAGVVFDEGGLPFHLYTGCGADLPCVNKPRFFRAVTGACIAIRKSDFFAVGGFDERYVNGLEDIDLCNKITGMGKGVLYNPQSVVTHFESRSENRQAAMPKNAELFKSIWCGNPRGDDFQYLRQDGMDLVMEDRFRMRFLPLSESLGMVRKGIEAGEALERSGDLRGAMTHYRSLFDRFRHHESVLGKLEDISLKVGMKDIADSFHSRRARMVWDPDYGHEFVPHLYAT